ncbi:MAG: hypothetical protein ACNYPE_14295 [Candidatus Azotimanducaceae bacterium WSBS_2022_MAG_OTU7]
MHKSIRKNIATLLLSLMLGVPSLALADHLHEDSNEEINCELCSFSSQAAAADEQPQKTTCRDRQQKSGIATRLPFETYRLNQYQRGPPLLR